MRNPDTKGEWRRWASDTARTLDWEASGERIRSVLSGYLAGLKASRIVTYLAMETEVDLAPLVPSHPQHQFILTRTPASGGLTLHAYDAPRERHRFGFDQPVARSPEVGPEDVDLVLVPGVAFDRRGVRLGHGKGYFDELLARVPAGVRIGVIPRQLVVRSLPSQSHDVRMSHLATEDGVSAVNPGGDRPPTNR